MNIWQKVHRLLKYAGATREEYEELAPEIYAYDRKRLMVMAGITIFFLTVMTAITSLNLGLGFSFYIYLIPLLMVLAIYLVTRFFTQSRPRLLKAMIYAFMSLMFLMAIYIGAIANKAQTAGTFLAFLLAIPMLFVLRPWQNICMIVFFDALFIVTVIAVKSPEVIPVDVINALVFGGVGSIVSTFMMTVTVENFVVKHRMTNLAERDQLTKLRNRTSYEYRIPSYPDRCRISLACIYADANGLHELNETGGHLAGDNMLCCIADALRDLFGVDHTYRIGGDEFVAFAVDVEEAALKEKVNRFIRRVEQAQYHVSVGCDVQRAGEIQMMELIKSAEQRMYQEKSAFYQRSENCRRRSKL